MFPADYFFLQTARTDPRKKKTLPFRESVLSPAVNYFRACLNIHLFLLKLAM